MVGMIGWDDGFFILRKKSSGLRTPWLPPRAGSRASGRDDGDFIGMIAFALFVVILAWGAFVSGIPPCLPTRPG